MLFTRHCLIKTSGINHESQDNQPSGKDSDVYKQNSQLVFNCHIIGGFLVESFVSRGVCLFVGFAG